MKEQEFPGKFIVIEGADGAGTTTQSKRLAEELDAYYTAEPSNDKAGKKVDEMISSGDYSAEAIALMFAADRMTHLEDEILPHLRDGETVISDRYYHSSLIYQATLGADYEWIKSLNSSAIKPDLTILLDVPTQVALSRIDKRERDISYESVPDTDDNSSQAHLTFFEDNSSKGDIFENMGFQEEVAARYRRLSERLNEDIVVVDSSGSIEEVSENVKKAVEEKLDF